EHLSKDEADYRATWEKKKAEVNCREISMRFKLAQTLPAGIPTWFIARQHRFTTNTHWYYGVLFADHKRDLEGRVIRAPRHYALLRTLPHDKLLELTVRGPDPRSFFALLRDGIETTFGRFDGLQITRKIPCPGHNGKGCSHEFNLGHLERYIEREPPKEMIE